MTTSGDLGKWEAMPRAKPASGRAAENVFESLFERSADAIWLYDPGTAQMIDCNQAAIDLIGAASKDELVGTVPEQISPVEQPDGATSESCAREIIARVEKEKTCWFEWVIKRFDGREVPLEVSSTSLQMNGRAVHVLISRDISERKRAERDLRDLTHALERRVEERTAALRASEASFRALVEHAPEAIVLYSVDSGRFLFGNQHACDLYGVTMSQLPNLTPADVSPEFQPCGRRTSELVLEKVTEVLEGGISVFEWVHRRPAGGLVPTEVRLLRLPAEGQRLIRASIIDNTERKLAERALRESEAKFRALFEGSSQGVLLHDENQLLEVNPAAVRITGRQSADELLGRHPSEIAPPFQANGEPSDTVARRYIDECLSRGSARFEWLARSASGNDIPLEVALTRIEWSGRQVIQAFITDISERQSAQQALSESEARFSVAFQASPVFTSMLRMSDGKFVLANDALVEWLGYAREEVLGRTAADLGIWEDSGECQAVWQDLRRTGSVRQRECQWRNRRGERCTILLSAEIITVDNAPHVLCLDLDITQRKQAEAETLKALARERELSQLKSNFVSMVSHEFRTPLGIIQSSAELLRDFYHKMPESEREEQLTSIIRNTQRMAGMMEEVLVLSRLDAGKLEFQPAALDLNGFCRRIVDEVLSATNRRCPIALSISPLPEEAQADERLLGHILTNLLSNAVKYSEPGATVTLSLRREGRNAVCVVRDEGIGIPREDQQRLFKAFHRGSNVGTRPGTGLGLLLVKRCTELHRGTFELDSAAGRGTTGTLTVPVF